MKVKNINESTDNYIKDNKFFVFNKYKTSKFYGSQEVEIPIKLRNILKKWLKINTNDFLFVDRHKRKLYPTTLNQRLNRIFEKNLGVSMLRHIYISDKVLKDVPKLDNLKKIANDMGHSVNEQLLYKKFDK
jgi:integrase